MADEIPEAAVEAAAVAWTNRVPDTTSSDRWKALTETGRRMRRWHMRIALTAALPHLTAEQDTKRASLVQQIEGLRGVITRQAGELAERDAASGKLDVDQLPADRVETLAQWLHGRNIGICEMDSDDVYNGIESMRSLAQELLQSGPDGTRITVSEVEAERLRARDAAWQKHVAHLESRLFDIWVLTEKRARTCNGLDHDDVCTVAELADTPPWPAVLAPSAPAQEDQA